MEHQPRSVWVAEPKPHIWIAANLRKKKCGPVLKIRCLHAEVHLWNSRSHSQLCITQPLSQEGDLSLPFLSTHPLSPFVLVLLLRQQTGTSYCWQITCVILLRSLFNIATLSILITVLWTNVRLQKGSRHVCIVSQCKDYSVLFILLLQRGNPSHSEHHASFRCQGPIFCPQLSWRRSVAKKSKSRRAFQNLELLFIIQC